MNEGSDAIWPGTCGETKGVSLGEFAWVELVVQVVEDDRNADTSVDVLYKLLGSVAVLLVIVLDGQSSLCRGTETSEVCAEAFECGFALIVNAADVDVDLVVRCSRELHHVKDLGDFVQLVDGIDIDFVSRRAEYCKLAGVICETEIIVSYEFAEASSDLEDSVCVWKICELILGHERSEVAETED